jgi:hypothetical protein
MEHRHTCSELVTIHMQTADGNNEELVSILEDISETGARLQLERPVPADSRLRMVCSNCEAHCEFGAHVVGSQLHDGIGYFTEIAFEPGTAWCPERYSPQHLLDISSLVGPSKQCSSGAAKCSCDGSVCPSEVISRAIDPFVPLAERVRLVGREVAKVCGSLDEETAAECFRNLFAVPPVCRLYREFLSAYQAQREKSEKRPARGNLKRHVGRIAELLNSIPEEALSR